MSFPRALCLITLFGFTSMATATSLVVTTDALVNALASSSKGTSNISSAGSDKKILLDAKNDAASFVASQGAVRGVQLQAALEHIRASQPQLQADDLQLAEAILAY